MILDQPNCNQHFAVLSSTEIFKELDNGNIVINPLTKNNIGNCSVDVTLGKHYYRHDTFNPLTSPIYNPWNPQHVREYWGTPQTAQTVTTEEMSQQLGVPVGTEYILLQSYETILAHTQEFIGGRHHITTMMKARSSMGRSGISICKDAGWGDIGYINRWTLEITNFSDYPVALLVGERIGQLVFYYTGIPIAQYHGNYQSSNDLNQLMNNWTPEEMLPKLRRGPVEPTSPEATQ